MSSLRGPRLLEASSAQSLPHSPLIQFFYSSVHPKKKMNDSSSCLLRAPLPPPTSGPACAVPVGRNLSAILASCCKTNSIATYGDTPDGISTCYQYCNITDPSLTYQDVSQCLLSAPGTINITAVTLCPGTFAAVFGGICCLFRRHLHPRIPCFARAKKEKLCSKPLLGA